MSGNRPIWNKENWDMEKESLSKNSLTSMLEYPELPIKPDKTTMPEEKMDNSTIS